MIKKRESGQATAEFALTILAFFTLIAFLVDGGRIFGNYVTVAQAARVGARYAITHGSKSASPVGPGNYTALRDQVQANAPGLISASTTVTATWSGSSNDPGSSVTVNVSYSVQPITSLFWGGATITLNDHSTMVIQN